MLIGISIPWYEMSCSYGTAIDIIPKNVEDGIISDDGRRDDCPLEKVSEE